MQTPASADAPDRGSTGAPPKTLGRGELLADLEVLTEFHGAENRPTGPILEFDTAVSNSDAALLTC